MNTNAGEWGEDPWAGSAGNNQQLGGEWGGGQNAGNQWGGDLQQANEQIRGGNFQQPGGGGWGDNSQWQPNPGTSSQFRSNAGRNQYQPFDENVQCQEFQGQGQRQMQGDDVWGMQEVAPASSVREKKTAVRVADEYSRNKLNQEAIQEYMQRPRNRGVYPKTTQKNMYKKHKHVPWYNRNTPRGYTRKAAVEFVPDPDEFDTSKLYITEMEQTLAFSKLKDPSLYGEEDLRSMMILMAKFPEEDEEHVWEVLNMNCGEIQVVYRYFEQKYP